MSQRRPLVVPDDGRTTRARRNSPVLADFTGPDGNVEWHEIGAGRKGIEW